MDLAQHRTEAVEDMSEAVTETNPRILPSADGIHYMRVSEHVSSYLCLALRHVRRALPGLMSTLFQVLCASSSVRSTSAWLQGFLPFLPMDTEDFLACSCRSSHYTSPSCFVIHSRKAVAERDKMRSGATMICCAFRVTLYNFQCLQGGESRGGARI